MNKYPLRIIFNLTYLSTIKLSICVKIILNIISFVQEICTLILAVEWNGDAMTLVNFLGLLMCLGGVISHVIYKAQHVECNRQKHLSDEASAVFLPIPNESSDEDTGNFDDDSSTEVLFNVLQIGERPR